MNGRDAGIHGGAERRAPWAAADLRHRQRRGRAVHPAFSGNADVELDSSLTKADFTPSIRAPLSTLPFLQVNATASYRTTYYSESLADDKKTQIDEPVTRNYGDMRIDVIGPVFSRVFNPNNAIADRMKHVVEPSFSVQRRTEIPNQDRIPTATGYDIIIGGVTQMSYGLTNRLLVRKDKEGEPQAGAPREMLNVSLRQSYYTDDEREQVRHVVFVRLQQPRARTRSRRSRWSPAPRRPMPLAIDYRLEYDPMATAEQSQAARHEPERHAAHSRASNVTGGWTRQAFTQTTQTGAVIEANNFVNAASDFRLQAEPIGGSVTFNYDIARSTLLNQRYVGFYNAQCCGVQFEYQSFNYPNNPNRSCCRRTGASTCRSRWPASGRSPTSSGRSAAARISAEPPINPPIRYNRSLA